MKPFVRDYFLPQAESFWRWGDNGEVLIWEDGATIAFREELVPIFERLADRGLPPMGMIALVLAATKENWERKFQYYSSVNAPEDDGYQIHAALPIKYQVQDLIQGVQGLQNVSQFSSDLLSDLSAKVELVDLALENVSDRTRPEQSDEIVEEIRNGLGAEICSWQLEWPYYGAPCDIWPEIVKIPNSLKDLAESTLRLRMQTGLDELPVATEEELPDCELARALITELSEDTELEGFARLTRNLMAAISLPKPVSDLAAMPLGGVSDITNRGPLDRLLLSELAHDDLTLAVRIAVNEAMYLRRENPSSNPDRHRVILLENGIRSWGIPKVFATAASLALIAKSSKETTVSTFRANGERIEPVDLVLRDGLIEQLGELSIDIHPGEALEAFEEYVNQLDMDTEPVLITTTDVWEDKNFQEYLSEVSLSVLYIGLVDRDGQFELIERTKAGRHTLRKNRFELNDLFAYPNASKEALIREDLASDLPAIFNIASFPLLLTGQYEQELVWHITSTEMIVPFTDRRLMLFETNDQGGYQLSDHIHLDQWLYKSNEMPGYAVPYVDPVPADEKVLYAVASLKGNDQQLLLLKYDRDSKQIETRHVGGHCNRATADGDYFVLLFNDHVKIYSRIDFTDPGKTLALPSKYTHQFGRFFTSFEETGVPNHWEDRWHVMRTDGNSLSFYDVPSLCSLPEEYDAFQYAFYTRSDKSETFFPDKVEGLIKELQTRGFDLKSISVDEEGKAIRIVNSVSHYRDIVVLTRGCEVLEPMQRYQWWIVQENLRSRIKSIGVLESGNLVMLTKKNVWLVIRWDPTKDRIFIEASTKLPESKITELVDFQKISQSVSFDFPIKKATFKDGSEVFLDGRGLLHLRSADDSISEVTLVLHDANVAGWSADGRTWGTEFFIGKGIVSADTKHIYNTIIQPFIDRLK
jgi:hypothetical protein